MKRLKPSKNIAFVIGAGVLAIGLFAYLKTNDIIPVELQESSTSAATYTKFIVKRVNTERSLVTGTYAHVSNIYQTTTSLKNQQGVQSTNPASFSVQANTSYYFVSASNKTSAGIPLKRVRRCIYPDANTTCTPTIETQFTCENDRCFIPMSIRNTPILVEFQYGR